jgi:hypothetical protein
MTRRMVTLRRDIAHVSELMRDSLILRTSDAGLGGGSFVAAGAAPSAAAPVKLAEVGAPLMDGSAANGAGSKASGAVKGAKGAAAAKRGSKAGAVDEGGVELVMLEGLAGAPTPAT